ncbi:MAG: dephospho-CoA kinase [Christensenellales bacterium]|jgi:dephospho-CoA kinase
MIVLGLTGGIATGKSTVSRVLAACGAAIWDADETSRKVVQPGQEGNEALRREFGDDYFFPDGSLKRAVLAKAVFDDPKKLLRLNAVIHPYILKDMCLTVARWRKEGKPVCVIDAPLLFETGADKVCDVIWVTACGVDKQISRLIKRNRLTEEEALARINAQMPEKERASRANRVIDTSDDKERTAAFVRVLYEELMEEAQTSGGN